MGEEKGNLYFICNIKSIIIQIGVTVITLLIKLIGEKIRYFKYHVLLYRLEIVIISLFLKFSEIIDLKCIFLDEFLILFFIKNYKSRMKLRSCDHSHFF